MIRRILFTLLLLLWLFLTVGAQADGFIIIHEPPPWQQHHRPPPLPHVPPPHFPFAPLEVANHRVSVEIDGQIAATTVEQEFVNPNDRALEGTYIFPVPKGAHIDKFSMEIGGKSVEAELLPADKARAIYEDIVRRLKDPALLEYAGRDVFKVRVFPIEAHGRKPVKISYSELLKSDNGLVTYLYPLATEKFSSKPLKSVGVKVTLKADAPLGTIYSPSHPVEVKREGGAKHAVVGWEAKDVKPDTDFQLVFAPEKADVGLRLLSFRDPDAGGKGTVDEQGWFLLLAAPSPEESATRKPAPKDVAFVLDTSGSMAGAKLAQAKKALEYCVASLNAEDRFEIVRFSTEAETLFGKLVEASDEHRKRAGAFIKDLRAAGGTAIADALKTALKIRPDAAGPEADQRPFVVIFLTDGQPTVGPTREDLILEAVRKPGGGSGEKNNNVRVFSFGIGNDVNTHLLDQLAETTRAFSQYVLPEEDIEVKVSNFFARIREPALTGLKLAVGEDSGAVRVSQVLPGELPDLFKGDQLVVVGRYRGAGEAEVRLTGQAGGREQRFTYRAKFGSADEGAGEAASREFIPRLWATRRVGFLLDEIRLRGESAEVKDEVVALARQFGIVTPYTAYLILEDEEKRDVPEPRRALSQMDKDRGARASAETAFTDFKKSKAGKGAVANAQSQDSLKRAEQPGASLAYGNQRALDAARSVVAATPPPTRAGGVAGSSAPLVDDAAQARLAGYTEGSARFVSGRAFYQNGRQWVDGRLGSAAATRDTRPPVRVQFGTSEYFTLLDRYPEAAPWLALGQNVLLALGDTAYEIYE